MDWNELIYTRRQEKVFQENVCIPDEILDKILQQYYETMPSKQGLFPYKVDVLDWSNVDLRHFLYRHSFDLDDDPVTCSKNPQTLAPHLICLTADTKKDSYFCNIEKGMAAMHFSYAITNYGYSTGFCGCVSNPSGVAEALGYDPKFFETNLMIGVGKRKDSGLYHCPIGNVTKKNGANRNEVKPEFNSWIRKRY